MNRSSENKNSSLRRRILFSVSALVILSLVGSTYSLIRITRVNHSLDAINQFSVPLGRLLAQLKTDSEILKREMDRKLGYEHWKEPHWKPQPIPNWIGDLLEHEIRSVQQLIAKAPNPYQENQKNDFQRWRSWIVEVEEGHLQLRNLARELYRSLDQGQIQEASKIYPKWMAGLQSWDRKIRWGQEESERALRKHFQEAESEVAGLKTGLQGILVVVVFLSLMLLWLGERALRPLMELTELVRRISERGLRKEDKAQLPEISVTRNDEVSRLAREFRSMATTVLEREKTVESQQRRLEEQNRLLRNLSSFNQNILNSIESIIVVMDSASKIKHSNPAANRWLQKSGYEASGVEFFSLEETQFLKDRFPGKGIDWFSLLAREDSGWRIDSLVSPSGTVFGGHLMPLRHEDGQVEGAILVLEDLTEQTDLENRLRLAEHLAAIGRMSAQVAHEVRNPLHSIGLEAELALEEAGKTKNISLKQSVQTILEAVDRLENITENYLKMTKPSDSKKAPMDLGSVLEDVLATYSRTCEEQGVQVDWSREKDAVLTVAADRSLMEQVLGNLLKNALQSLSARQLDRDVPGKVTWRLGNAERGIVWVQIADNGPGVDPSIRETLFNPFTTTKAQGTGLGLSFVRKVIEEHGGSIRCVEVSEGACFELQLPVSLVTDVWEMDRESKTENPPC